MQSYTRKEWLEAFKECDFELTDERDSGGVHAFEAVKWRIDYIHA